PSGEEVIDAVFLMPPIPPGEHCDEHEVKRNDRPVEAADGVVQCFHPPCERAPTIARRIVRESPCRVAAGGRLVYCLSYTARSDAPALAVDCCDGSEHACQGRAVHGACPGVDARVCRCCEAGEQHAARPGAQCGERRAMTLRLVQLCSAGGTRMVAALDDAGEAHRVAGVATTYELALAAIDAGSTLAALAQVRAAERIDIATALADGRVLPPIDHPDSAHLCLSGTGLTHLGSAESRDRMHKAAAAGEMTDSMRMFLLGLEGGKP